MNFAKITAVGMALSLALLAVAPQAKASGSPQSLYVTNYMVASQNVVGFPTNQQVAVTNAATGGSNYVGSATGLPVYIGNYEHIGFNIQGTYVGTNISAGAIGFTLTSSMAGATPGVTVGTNNLSAGVTEINATDWATPWANSIGLMSFTLPTPIAPSANVATNIWINWSTNWFMGSGIIFPDANWIGVYQLSNNMPTGCYLTNVVVTINRKLIPTPLIGN